MTIETLLVLGSFCCALTPFLVVYRRTIVDPAKQIKAIWGFWLALAGVFIAMPFFGVNRPISAELAVTNRPVQLPTDGYVGSDACRTCHPHNHETWSDSYHRTMTQAASEKSVLGNFDNVQLAGKDLKVRLFKNDHRFFADLQTTNPDMSGTYPIVMTTGSHNRQVYWMSRPSDPRLMVLPYMFVKAEQKWIPRSSAYITPMCLQDRPEMSVFQADFGRWSAVCIRCHTTNGRPRPIGEEAHGRRGKASEAQVAEFGISCEACHGPGAEHIRVNQDPFHRYEQHLFSGSDPHIVNPAKLPHDRSSEVCGQCHSVFVHRDDEAQRQWVQRGYSFRPGDDLFKDPIRFMVRGRSDQMPAERPDDWRDPYENGSFWPDGMIRASGREFNALIDSPCYQRGTLSCQSCHQMHQPRNDPRPREVWADDQLKLGMEGNRACVECHAKFRDTDRLTQHTHHAAGSSGSNCYNCHMPYTTYGITKAIRSHQIDTPSVKTSQETGRPQACNQCHLDKSLAWTSEYMSQWYKTPVPKLSEDESRIAASVLWTLRGDAGQRALMAWSYGWDDALHASGNHWQAPYLAQLLDDRYDPVRLMAHRSLRKLSGFQAFEFDFVGSAQHRADAHRRARQQWESGSKSGVRFAPAVLIDERGRVLDKDFERLWSQRDDRPMAVNE